MIRIPGKIPITIHTFFWVMAFVIGWLVSHSGIGMVMWAVVIFVSILVHEYGHALTAVAFGQRANISLVGFGGITQRSGKQIKRWQEFLVVLNGPIAGLLLYGVSLFCLTYLGFIAKFPILKQILNISVEINLLWTLLNLIPVQPLDGGRIFSLFLEMLFGFRGLKIALFCSIVFATVLAGYFFLQNWVIAGILFVFFAYESFSAWREARQVSETDQNSTYHDLFKSAENDLAKHHDEAAFQKYNHILEHVSSGLLHVVAHTRIAQLLAKKGEVEKAYHMLLPLKNKLDFEGLYVLHQLAFVMKEWEVAADVGRPVFQQSPDYNVALINAKAYAELNQIKPAIGWLRSAIAHGLSLTEAVLKDPSFDNIRQDPQFPSSS